MKNSQNICDRYFPIDYYTIFSEKLQILLDKTEKMIIIKSVRLGRPYKRYVQKVGFVIKEVICMKKVKINLNSITAVKDFVSIVMLYDFDIDLVSGRYAVDAKSIMGIFSLDLSNSIQLVAHTEEPGDFFDKIKDFIVE